MPAFAILMALMCLKGAEAAGWLPGRGVALVGMLSNRGLNKEGREALTAGYYEGLINEGSRVSAMTFLAGGREPMTFKNVSQPERRETHDFLVWELIPNSDTPDYRDQRQRYRLKTNSAGFADREYSVEKPEGMRRIALMGDSVTRGEGAPFQGTYEALLEERLNRPEVRGGRKGLEILNLAVGAYNVTQMMETAKVKAVRYQPDMYVVALTQLTVYRRWGDHIALLINSGIDLKYDFLRNVAREAGLKANEPVGEFWAKLARFRLPTIKWALEEVKAHAAANHATMVVLLVPSVEDRAALEEDFLGVRELLRDLKVPVIDLLPTFEHVDLAQYKVSDVDHHPNAAGHRLLYERLDAAVEGDPQLARIFLGPDGN